ncbi:EipB family protein [Humitalea sp. 24SJ18S-53]|uniref:EipB family protein n=1 Tax=Humitalea sp. 24SJ18S-53 TaxID=3422307 RepID=UPI003D66F9F6
MRRRPSIDLFRPAVALLFAGLLGAQAPASPPAPGAIAGMETLLAHRAAYSLTLERARDRSQIREAKGAMVFEVTDACEGWATRQRLTMTLTDTDGNDIDTASDYSTYESKDGRRLRFSMVQTANGAIRTQVTGEALLEADGSGVVRYAQPTVKEERLPPGTLLPMLHTLRAVQLARGGGRILTAPLFDGTSEDGAQDSTTIIAGWSGPQPNERFPSLAALSSARMRIAFFSRAPADGASGGASAPEYEVGLRYFENGVADELSMDFGEFAMGGRMLEMVPLPGGC